MYYGLFHSVSLDPTLYTSFLWIREHKLALAQQRTRYNSLPSNIPPTQRFYSSSLSLTTKPKTDKKSKVDESACTDMVVWGTNLRSTVGYGRITKQVRDMIALAPYQYSVIVGLLLSDGTFWRGSTNKSPRLELKQSLAHCRYLLFVFNILVHYCEKYPVLKLGKREGKLFYGILFYTRHLTCFNKLQSIFYVNNVKVIPEDVYNLLTPVALAHVIMGDGAVKPHGLILCTDSYSVQDVVRFMNVLIIKYRFECTLRFHRPNQPRIYIRQRSMGLLRTIVTPHMDSSMLYKLG